MEGEGMKRSFSEGFRRSAHATGSIVCAPAAFQQAYRVVLIWAGSGPLFAFSDTWQLVINTGTTIVTFLMVFLIQNTQNRDSRALHMKLDELILYTKGASNHMVEVENLSEEQLDRLEAHVHQLAKTTGRGDIEQVTDDEPLPDRETRTHAAGRKPEGDHSSAGRSNGGSLPGSSRKR
jgi:low affinity Fe/Cu permease